MGGGVSLSFPQGLEVISAPEALQASLLSPMTGCDWDKQEEGFVVARDIWPPVAASAEERVKNHTHGHFCFGDEQSKLLTDGQWDE